MSGPSDLVLGIDCGFDRLGLCLIGSTAAADPIAATSVDLNSANLRPALDELGQLRLESIAAIAIGVGPGKFSAIRTGLAFALGIGVASGANLYGIDLFAALAQIAVPRSGPLLLVSSGGARRLFAQLGRCDGPEWRPDGDPFVYEGAAGAPDLSIWQDPRDLALPLPQPAALLVARAGARRLAEGSGDESHSVRPLYVAAPALGPRRQPATADV